MIMGMTENAETDTEKTSPKATIPSTILPYVTTYAAYRASGKSQTEAARLVGRARITATRWESADWWPEVLEDAKRRMIAPVGVEAALKPHVQKALDTMVAIMEYEGAPIEQRRLASQWLLERYYGKALTQTVTEQHTTHHLNVGEAVRVLKEAKQRALAGGELEADFTVLDDDGVSEESNGG